MSATLEKLHTEIHGHAVKKLSRPSLVRLQRYLEELMLLQAAGQANVTSAELAARTEITSETVRQDFCGLGADGRPRVGYEVGHLVKVLRAVFDLDSAKPICLVGLGNLGRALAASDIWQRSGFRLEEIFDSSADVAGSFFNGMLVRNITEVIGVLRTRAIEAAVLTAPAQAAQSVADTLVTAGVKSIWNFAPVSLHVPDEVVVENQFLGWGLITLSFRSRTVNAVLQPGDGKE